jgi:hypothetical protein
VSTCPLEIGVEKRNAVLKKASAWRRTMLEDRNEGEGRNDSLQAHHHHWLTSTSLLLRRVSSSRLGEQSSAGRGVGSPGGCLHRRLLAQKIAPVKNYLRQQDLSVRKVHQVRVVVQSVPPSVDGRMQMAGEVDGLRGWVGSSNSCYLR